MFFRTQEFKATRVLRNYYDDSGEDAFLMEYRVGGPDAGPAGLTNRVAQYEES